MYWYREPQPGINWDAAQSMCEAMHPNMSLAEMDQPGEQTAVIDNYVKVVYPGGFYIGTNKYYKHTVFTQKIAYMLILGTGSRCMLIFRYVLIFEQG